MVKNILFIKFVAIFLILSVVFSFTGCFDYSYIDETADSITNSSNEDKAETSDEIKFNLPYITSDTLNPFYAKTEINRNLTSLLYDSLFSVDNNFKPNALMAESYSNRDKQIVIKLKNNLHFTDLGEVSANDVVFSFNTAKSSERYKNILSKIKSAEASDSRTIIFRFSTDIIDACSLLTFPIVKLSSTNSEKNKNDVPIGSGRYILSKNTNNELYLTANTNRLTGYKPIYSNIGLVSTSDEKAAASNFSLGHINVLIDTFSDGIYEKCVGATNKHNLTNIVYLVCNSKNKIFDDTNVKKAISLAIDREEIANYSFVSFAKPTFSPFHPDYYKTNDYSFDKLVFNVDYANKILDNIGYSSINTKYNFRHSDGKIMEFDLAVCKDNPFKLSAARIIKEQMKKISIHINIRSYTEEDFFKIISSGKYDMYIGECRLTNNFELTPFFNEGSSASYGIPKNTKTQSKYNQYIKNEIEISELLDSFNEEMPFIPILYRCASVNSNSGMAVSNFSIITDYYNNIDKWKTAND